MATYTEEVIAIKERDFQEADRIFTFISKTGTKFDAVAKGIRKIKSRKAGNISFLKHSKCSFAHGKQLDIITEAQLIDDFSLSSDSPKNYRDLFLLAEITEKLIPDGYETERVFFSLKEVLDRVGRPTFRQRCIAFTLKILEEMGFSPDLYNCASCSKSFTKESSIYKTDQVLGFYDNCHKESNSPVTVVILKSLRFLQQNSVQHADSLKLQKSQIQELEAIVIGWVEQVLERPLKSFKL